MTRNIILLRTIVVRLSGTCFGAGCLFLFFCCWWWGCLLGVFVLFSVFCLFVLFCFYINIYLRTYGWPNLKSVYRSVPPGHQLGTIISTHMDCYARDMSLFSVFNVCVCFLFCLFMCFLINTKYPSSVWSERMSVCHSIHRHHSIMVIRLFFLFVCLEGCLFCFALFAGGVSFCLFVGVVFLWMFYFVLFLLGFYFLLFRVFVFVRVFVYLT